METGNTHFEFEVIPAGQWQRLDDTYELVARPHIVPVTEKAERFMETVIVGLVRGVANGKPAYRFKNLLDPYTLIRLLNMLVDKVSL